MPHKSWQCPETSDHNDQNVIPESFHYSEIRNHYDQNELDEFSD